MAGLQELDIHQVKETIRDAANRHLPVTVTVRHDERWINLQSRLLDIDPQRIYIQIPTNAEGHPWELGPAEKVGVTVKLKHHKYVFVSTVAGPDAFELDDGQKLPVVGLCWPSQMQRLQRRAYYRADVPEGCVIRASMWLGGMQSEPQQMTPDHPVFVGRVTNLSAGGFQFRTADDPGDRLETGYLAGVRIGFGPGQPSVFADAEIRHVAHDNGEIVVGLQFVGLEQTHDGRQILRIIGGKVTELQRMSLRTMAPSSLRV